MTMSAENISAFIDKMQTDIPLREKVSALYAEADQAMAEALAALSQEAGTPFAAEDILSLSQAALSEADLSAIAGGTVAGEKTVVTRFGLIKRSYTID